MEALRQDDPRRIGPYALLLRLRETASAVQYLAHAADGSTAVVAVARPGLAELPAFRRRFEAEARTAERLAGGWVQAPLGTAAEGSAAQGPELWTATAYLPALTLAEAVALAGPLPERTVRVLGAALAETLSRVHATGAVLHGLAADTVLLASDGPRLTAFGALGAAAAAEAGPDGQLSVRLGYLTPEQLAGQEPGPASDIFVLGLLLAYAATGATPLAAGPEAAAADRIANAEPELAAVPAELRTLIARCLAKSPASRPTPGTLATVLALEGAAALARPGWLPDSVLSALANQASKALSLDPAAAVAGTGAGPQLLIPLPAPPWGEMVQLRRVRGSAPDPAPQTPDGLKGSAEQKTHQPERTPAAPPANDDGPHPARPTPVEPPTNGDRPMTAEANQARPAIEDTPEGRPGAWGLAPSRGGAANVTAGKGRVGESFAGPPTDAADIDGGQTRRLRAPHRPAPPGPNGAVPQPTAAPTGPNGNAPQPTATPLTHPATALALPPASISPPPPTHPFPPPTQPPPPRPHTRLSRRELLAGIGAGAAGLALGVGGGALAFSDRTDSPSRPNPTPTPKPPTPRNRTIPGTAPAPLWHYQHPVALDSDGPPTHLWRDQLLLIPGKELTTALDLRTGRRLWEQKAAGTTYAPDTADDTHCFVVTPTDFLWLSAKDGLVKHRAPYEPLLAKDQKDTRVTLGEKAAAAGRVVWFSAKVETLGKKEKVTRTRTYLFAYDMAARKELWRAEMPNGRPGTVPRYESVGIRPDSLLLRQDTDSQTAAQEKKTKGRPAFILIDRRTGKTLWRKFFTGLRPEAGATDDPSGRLYAAVEGDLQAYDTRSGKKLWKLQSDNAPFGSGNGVVRDKTLYVADGVNHVYAVDTATGSRRWRRATEYPSRATPSVALSGSGRTVLALNETQATAFGARDGQRLWKFQDAGGTAPGAEKAEDDAEPVASYGAQTFGRTAVVWRGRNFYALPLD